MAHDVAIDHGKQGVVWTPEHAAEQVRAVYSRSVESVFALGQVLIEAKKLLPHGQWSDAVALMPFSETTAKRYMRVAANKVLCTCIKSATVADLPASVVTLDALTQLPNSELEKMIGDGKITAETTRDDVYTLVANHKSQVEAAQRQAVAQLPGAPDRSNWKENIAYREAFSAGSGRFEAKDEAGREAVLAYRRDHPPEDGGVLPVVDDPVIPVDEAQDELLGALGEEPGTQVPEPVTATGTCTSCAGLRDQLQAAIGERDKLRAQVAELRAQVALLQVRVAGLEPGQPERTGPCLQCGKPGRPVLVDGKPGKFACEPCYEDAEVQGYPVARP